EGSDAGGREKTRRQKRGDATARVEPGSLHEEPARLHAVPPALREIPGRERTPPVSHANSRIEPDAQAEREGPMNEVGVLADVPERFVDPIEGREGIPPHEQVAERDVVGRADRPARRSALVRRDAAA